MNPTVIHRAIVTGAVFLGIALGVGAFAFLYADGGSYLRDDPRACGNCHIMLGQLDAWAKGSHHSVATCNDCHAPHGSLAAKLFTKGLNGWNHSVAFTTGRHPDPIRITAGNRAVTEGTCRYCHGDLVDGLDGHGEGEDASCIRCHATVGHDA